MLENNNNINNNSNDYIELNLKKNHFELDDTNNNKIRYIKYQK